MFNLKLTLANSVRFNPDPVVTFGDGMREFPENEQLIHSYFYTETET